LAQIQLYNITDSNYCSETIFKSRAGLLSPQAIKSSSKVKLQLHQNIIVQMQTDSQGSTLQTVCSWRNTSGNFTLDRTYEMKQHANRTRASINYVWVLGTDYF